MPKNKGKGGKNRRRGKNENDNEKRELTFKEEGQEYAQVIKMLGNGRLEALCFDGTRRLAHIRGKLRKKVWINQGDIILLSLRDYQDEKGDVILKYSADEARSLKAYGELPRAQRSTKPILTDKAKTETATSSSMTTEIVVVILKMLLKEERARRLILMISKMFWGSVAPLHD
ncbi:eukaryotic translation initiation factor 1a [Botrytis cinerea]